MKVFEVLIFSCYDYETDIITRIFAKEEDARVYFEDRVKCARLEAEEYLHEDEREECYSTNSYEVYKDGYAIEYEVSITLNEKEVE